MVFAVSAGAAPACMLRLELEDSFVMMAVFVLSMVSVHVVWGRTSIVCVILTARRCDQWAEYAMCRGKTTPWQDSHAVARVNRPNSHFIRKMLMQNADAASDSPRCSNL